MSASVTEIDIGIEQFVSMLFSEPPKPPFSYHIGGSEALLGHILVTGAQHLYSRELSSLSEREIATLREYLLSIGWDADYHLATLYKEALDYKPNGSPYLRKIKVNNWQITFKQADSRLIPNMMQHHMA